MFGSAGKLPLTQLAFRGPSLSASRVVIVSGHADVMIVGDIERSGVRVLSKPLRPEMLLETCRTVLGKEDHMAGDLTLTRAS
jgi:FixJ family two-component response regulator